MIAAPFSIPDTILTQWGIAIDHPSFKKYDIDAPRLNHAAHTSSQRSLQRLLQALLREGILSSDSLERIPHGYRLALSPTHHLVFDGLIQHRMNAWSLTGGIYSHPYDQPVARVYLPAQLLDLLLPALTLSTNINSLVRLSEEIDNSFMNDTLCIAFHDAWSTRLKNAYIKNNTRSFLAGLRRENAINVSLLLEQWGTTGHPWHPNCKTKLGLATSEVIDYSPEFESSFNVLLYAVHRDFMHIESLPDFPDYSSELMRWLPGPMHELGRQLEAMALNAHDYIALPVHPWQAEKTLPKLFAAEIRDQLLIVTRITAFIAHPTMSFRTVLPEASAPAPMVKLPVGLGLTSAQRTVSPRSACMGPRVSALLMKILKSEPGLQKKLTIVAEHTGLHFRAPGVSDDRARHLSALYRANLSDSLEPGEIAIPVGSLFAMDHEHQPLLRHWVSLSEGTDTTQAVLQFLDCYLYAALPGILGMYVLYGVAFEAHQQNSLMIMGADGHPSRLLLRDFGDIRIDKTTLHQRGFDLQLEDSEMTLYDDASIVRDKLLHAAFMCHFGELLLLIAQHWAVAESDLWEVLSAHVNCCFDDLRERAEPQRWQTERAALLIHDWPAKSLLRMRLVDSRTDITGRLKNPLNHDLHAV
ncbi:MULTISPECIES: IucA/IucC family protein [unclassified Pseudomonas]|uniref:IucA/IucC family protein n=1 Tax=unclassified Pseudomonas TaxID=196821 RepID=UPI002114FFAD|nr:MULTISPECIES: IucA/IucC family protein [unclassified Pseudomonas]